MPTTREVKIEYFRSDKTNKIGVRIYRKTPSMEREVLCYQSHKSAEIPEYVKLHMNYAKIEIVNVEM